jgi:hypothetical protein
MRRDASPIGNRRVADQEQLSARSFTEMTFN